jgi:hypothetical protein
LIEKHIDEYLSLAHALERLHRAIRHEDLKGAKGRIGPQAQPARPSGLADRAGHRSSAAMRCFAASWGPGFLLQRSFSPAVGDQERAHFIFLEPERPRQFIGLQTTKETDEKKLDGDRRSPIRRGRSYWSRRNGLLTWSSVLTDDMAEIQPDLVNALLRLIKLPRTGTNDECGKC